MNQLIAENKTARIVAIDLLRGLTIGFMIMVNNKGGPQSYWAVRHSSWDGCTPTDLVFPIFLFLVGISVVFSVSSRLAKGESRRFLFLHIVRRAVLLCLFGWLINCFPHAFRLSTFRVYGVLPRIALCYFVVASLYLLSPAWKTKAVLAASLLVGYWMLLRFVPVPGYGFPGRDVPFMDMTGNLAAWLDRLLFSPAHLYQHTRDPEGLLATLPSIATTLFGLLAGKWLQTKRSIMEKGRMLAGVGVAGIVAGEVWNVSFPFNKQLWTSSYVLFAAGWGALLLGLFLLVEKCVDEPLRVARVTRPVQSALLVFGVNAIAAYIFSELFQGVISNFRLSPGGTVQQWMYDQVLRIAHNPYMASLVYSWLLVGICWVMMFILYRRKIVIKI